MRDTPRDTHPPDPSRQPIGSTRSLESQAHATANTKPSDPSSRYNTTTSPDWKQHSRAATRFVRSRRLPGNAANGALWEPVFTRAGSESKQ
ncbi:hypothetical protein BST61_g515 [Cercospora zeina]